MTDFELNVKEEGFYKGEPCDDFKIHLESYHPGVPGYSVVYKYYIVFKGERISPRGCNIRADYPEVFFKADEIIIPDATRQMGGWMTIDLHCAEDPDYTAKLKINLRKYEMTLEDNFETFNTDINGDKVPDRITKIRHESGTAHFWDEYKIELNQDGRYRDITPKGLRTTVGAECALQQIQFQYKPNFKIIKISRPWRDSWTGPSMATRTIYTLENNKLVPDAGENLGTVCDVSELF